MVKTIDFICFDHKTWLSHEASVKSISRNRRDMHIGVEKHIGGSSVIAIG